MCDKLSWKVPEGIERTHFDCIVHPVSEYIQIKKYGFGQKDISYSNMIRDGQISRNEAIEMIRKQSRDEPKEMEVFLRLINITRMI
ncbi:hypothetical protein ABDB91_18295 [Desulfoscipio sp. XC116]|uniref:hypothetical protein n=1 Tax=Desulfoscipio sp. XC116 TaxID=3144975 RepID=UPI00325A8014